MFLINVLLFLSLLFSSLLTSPVSYSEFAADVEEGEGNGNGKGK